MSEFESEPQTTDHLIEYLLWGNMHINADAAHVAAADHSIEYLRWMDEMRQKFLSEYVDREEKSTSELYEDVKTLTKKLHVLESKVTSHDSLIEELEFRTNSIPFEKNLDDMVSYIQKDFEELEFVTGVHYVPLEGGTFQLIVIHNMENRVKALQLIRKKFLDIENAFSDVDFQQVLLHRNEVQPDHLMGTKPIFQSLWNEK